MKPNLTVEEAAALHGVALATFKTTGFEDLHPQLRQAEARLEGALQRAGAHKVEEGWLLPKGRIRYQPANVELKREEAIPLVVIADLITSLTISSGREYGMRKALAKATMKLASALERAGVGALA